MPKTPAQESELITPEGEGNMQCSGATKGIENLATQTETFWISNKSVHSF